EQLEKLTQRFGKHDYTALTDAQRAFLSADTISGTSRSFGGKPTWPSEVDVVSIDSTAESPVLNIKDVFWYEFSENKPQAEFGRGHRPYDYTMIPGVKKVTGPITPKSSGLTVILQDDSIVKVDLYAHKRRTGV
ncbi:hypothetical protein KY337_01605, partial [Candidatus Woesearchaeota archaeon]|nr:hypothetical protein [Candidatus Woesearchaeota archaeon]